MAGGARHFGVGSCKNKSRIAVVYKFFGRPCGRRAVATEATGLSGHAELPAVHVGVTGGTVGRSGSIHHHTIARFGHMALLASRLPMAIAEEEGILAPVLVDGNPEGAGVRQMAGRAVAPGQRLIELPLVRILVAVLAGR